jgi:hypothetical protein
MTNDEEVTGSKQFFFAIFGTFGRHVRNLKGTFVVHVKKIQNQPTLLYVQCTLQYLWSPSQEFLTNIDAVPPPTHPSYIMMVHRNLRYLFMAL